MGGVCAPRANYGAVAACAHGKWGARCLTRPRAASCSKSGTATIGSKKRRKPAGYAGFCHVISDTGSPMELAVRQAARKASVSSTSRICNLGPGRSAVNPNPRGNPAPSRILLYATPLSIIERPYTARNDSDAGWRSGFAVGGYRRRPPVERLGCCAPTPRVEVASKEGKIGGNLHGDLSQKAGLLEPPAKQSQHSGVIPDQKWPDHPRPGLWVSWLADRQEGRS